MVGSFTEFCINLLMLKYRTVDSSVERTSRRPNILERLDPIRCCHFSCSKADLRFSRVSTCRCSQQ